MTKGVKQQVAQWLANEAPRSLWRGMLRAILFVTIFAAVIAAILDTMRELGPSNYALLGQIQFVARVIFALEYVLRIWTAPFQYPNLKPSAARGRYMTSALGVVDFVAILPYGLSLFGLFNWRVVDALELLALLKVARYAPALSLVASVFRNEARSLWSAFVSMMVLLVIASGLMYLIEGPAQPTIFTSIPRAMWWGIVTMATVGYGDMTPITPLGRVVGGMVMLFGIAMFAVPAGIMATGFASEIRKRDFVVTWQAVARVPLFARLDASDISSISRLLKPLYLPARQAVVRRGETADAMYFILAGEVEVDVAPNPVRLGPGQFFGEVALLNDTMRTATVTTLNECRLLMLDAVDFRRLLDQYPDMRANVQQTAAARSAS